MSEVRADIRAAIRRLFAACRTEGIDVVVQRRDVELILAVFKAQAPLTLMPSLHPEQR